MLNYTDEIKLGIESAQLRYRPSANHTVFETASASITIFYPDGHATAIVQSEMQWNATSHELFYIMDTTGSNWSAAKNYRAEMIIASGTDSFYREFYFDICKTPWKANTTVNDLIKLAPMAGYNHGGDLQSCETAIVEAEEQLRVLLRASGFAPADIADHSTLDACHRYLALSIFYLQSSGNGDSVMWSKHEKWQELHEQTFKHLVTRLKLDLNQDGAIDGETQNLTSRRFEP